MKQYKISRVHKDFIFASFYKFYKVTHIVFSVFFFYLWKSEIAFDFIITGVMESMSTSNYLLTKMSRSNAICKWANENRHNLNEFILYKMNFNMALVDDEIKNY